MTTQQPQPLDILFQMLMARTVSFSLAAIARLGAADHMTSGYKPVDEIAAGCGAQPGQLYRLLRLIASTGAMRQQGRSFALTPVTELLQTNAKGSMRNMAQMFMSEWVMRAYGELDRCATTGKDGVTLAYGKNAWNLFPEIPEQAALFHRAMQDLTANAVEALLVGYDFTGVSRLADVGGGYGTLLAGVLRKYPSMRGVLFDLPEVIAQAREASLFAGSEDRVEFQSGSFLESAPAGCDAYIMKHIIHDWSDDFCRQIFRGIREKMAPGARLLLFEMVVPETNEPGPAKVLDIEMMIATDGGMERTESEFAALLDSAGFRLTRIVATPGPMSVIEAEPR